jgi:nucleotidyltransferase substrate binding protein (TIGR01987 family)
MEQDIRWLQRFSNYKKALVKLSQAISKAEEEDKLEIDDEDYDDELYEIIKEGLIQRFEYTHELAWNVMKDYAHYQGNAEIRGSRDATREAFKMKLIENGDEWMDMIGSRNLTTHAYDENVTHEIYKKIIKSYFSLFQKFEKQMEEIATGEQFSLF